MFVVIILLIQAVASSSFVEGTDTIRPDFLTLKLANARGSVFGMLRPAVEYVECEESIYVSYDPWHGNRIQTAEHVKMNPPKPNGNQRSPVLQSFPRRRHRTRSDSEP